MTSFALGSTISTAARFSHRRLPKSVTAVGSRRRSAPPIMQTCRHRGTKDHSADDSGSPSHCVAEPSSASRKGEKGTDLLMSQYFQEGVPRR